MHLWEQSAECGTASNRGQETTPSDEETAPSDEETTPTEVGRIITYGEHSEPGLARSDTSIAGKVAGRYRPEFDRRLCRLPRRSASRR